jgi:hypothetical protein
MKKNITAQSSKAFADQVGKALKRSANNARKLARQYGTPVYIWRDGKVIALKP